jgi:hypothetical protein
MTPITLSYSVYSVCSVVHHLPLLAPEWVSRAEQQLAEVIPAFEKSHLQDQPDREQVNRLLVEIREGF